MWQYLGKVVTSVGVLGVGFGGDPKKIPTPTELAQQLLSGILQHRRLFVRRASLVHFSLACLIQLP